MFEMNIAATERGYHAYIDNAFVRIGEILAYEMEFWHGARFSPSSNLHKYVSQG